MTVELTRGSASTSLEGLLGSLPVARFWTDYWERRHLLLPGAQNPGLKAIFRGLFSFERADQVLSVPGPRFEDFIRLSEGGHPIPSRDYSVPRHDGTADFDVERVLELYADGTTITLNRAHQCSEELAALCVDLSRELHAHINANVYMTPPNGQGFSVHSDTHDVFLLHVEGRKRWRIQETLEYLSTPRNPNVTSDPLAVQEWVEFDLDAGDAVYIPRGLLHEGIADASHSLHITLGIHPYTWADMVRDVVADVEAKETLLRQSTTGGPTGFEDALSTVTSRLTARLSDPTSIGLLVSERTEHHQAGAHRGRFRKVTTPPPITLTTAVRVRAGLEASLERFAGEGVLRFGTKSLTFPLYVFEHLQMLLGSTGITAAQLPSDLDDAGKLTLLRRLLSERVIVVCQEEQRGERDPAPPASIQCDERSPARR